jgi:hypothetical protein
MWEVGRRKCSLGLVGMYKSNYTWCAYSSTVYTLREEEYRPPLPRRASRTEETKSRKLKRPRKRPGRPEYIAKGITHPASQWHVKFYRTSGCETLGFWLFSLTPATPLTGVQDRWGAVDGCTISGICGIPVEYECQSPGLYVIFL